MKPYKPIFEDTPDFGKYLFGDYRNKPEEDTPEEIEEQVDIIKKYNKAVLVKEKEKIDLL